MNIRAWSISLLLFLSTVTAVGQTANRYLKAPLPNDWEENGEVFQQTLPVDDHWWKSFGDSKLDSLIALAVDRNYSVAMAINRQPLGRTWQFLSFNRIECRLDPTGNKWKYKLNSPNYGTLL